MEHTDRHRQPRHTLVVVNFAVALFSLIAFYVLSPPFRRTLQRTFIRAILLLAAWVPLPFSLDKPSDLAVAIRSFSDYTSSQQAALHHKHLAYARMPRVHRAIGAKLRWKETLERAEDAVELNSRVTDALAGLGREQARRDGSPYGLRSKLHTEQGRVVETLKHFVRDWSAEGKSERDALFPPILDALTGEYSEREGKKVLVPGCGLGRLAYEIALLGFSVDANDYSHFMNLGSTLIFSPLHTSEPSQHAAAPYVHSFSHQRTAADLVRTVRFPDVVPDPAVVQRLAFMPGDFVELFPGEATHDAVVTLFFIDTARNLLAYFSTIHRALRPGGVWLNAGPLLYHGGGPAMQLPLEDVVRAAELVGFVVERREALREVRYTADEKGMYTFAYDCDFWVARKPRTAGAGARAGKTAQGRGE
ncbi:hypothetical protein JCM10207_000896 [Rhodosporidiobolus poonsookiae]